MFTVLKQTLRKDDQWTITTHRVMLTTIDSNYDDPETFDLQVYVPLNAEQDSLRSIKKEVFVSKLLFCINVCF